jgi:hypothetical protein
MSEVLYVILEDKGDNQFLARKIDFEKDAELRELQGQYNKLNRDVEKELGYKMPLPGWRGGLSGSEILIKNKFLGRIDEMAPGLRKRMRELEREQLKTLELFVGDGRVKLEKYDVFSLEFLTQSGYKPRD